jgi:hypothetical protein
LSETVYVATEHIYLLAPHIMAYPKGAVVPQRAIEKLDARDKVKSLTAKAGQEAVKEAAAKAAVRQPVPAEENSQKS